MGAHGPKTGGFEVNIPGEDRTETRKGKRFAYLAGLLFLVTVVFVVLFVVYYVKYEDKKVEVVQPRPSNLSVCMTLDCVKTATELSRTMDLSADPCHDFAQYTCGKFYRETIIPDDRLAVHPFYQLDDENNQIFRRIVEEKIQPGDADFIKKIKSFYQACMSEDQIERIGVTPYTSSNERDEWPTVNSAWDVKTFNLKNLVVKYERVFTEGLFGYTIMSNFSNSDVYAFTLQQPTFGLGLGQMMQARNHSSIMAYQQYYVDMVTALGADNATANIDAKAMVDFEVKLAKISVTPEEEAEDSEAVNNPMTLTAMSRTLPYLDWPRVVQAIYSSMNMTIVGDLVVNPWHAKYFDRLEMVLKNTDPRKSVDPRTSNKVDGQNIDMATALGADNATAIIDAEAMVDFEVELAKVKDGIKKELPRWNQCTDKVSTLYKMGLGKLFVDRTFSEDAKHIMDEMITNLKDSFKDILDQIKWMGETTKSAAYRKLENVRQKIGYPDTNFTYGDLDKRYEEFKVQGDFYHTFLETSRDEKRITLRKLFRPVDHAEWAFSPSTVNAYYERSSNAINFPAGILQPIFFSSNYPRSLNYGAIGMVIGHELTHGFDQTGSQYGESGNLENWWDDKDRQEFLKRTECLVNQYSSFRVDQVALNVNGNRTLGENIADNGGIKEAFKAYMKVSASKNDPEPPLPGLGLTPEQQFFLAFARVFCFKQTDADMRAQVLNHPHSPAQYRIVGTLQNSEDFARVFKCAPGSPMNPSKKCSVW